MPQTAPSMTLILMIITNASLMYLITLMFFNDPSHLTTQMMKIKQNKSKNNWKW